MLWVNLKSVVILPKLKFTRKCIIELPLVMSKKDKRENSLKP